MPRRFHPLLYVILPLAVLGFAYQFEMIWNALLIPIGVIALLFVIYLIVQKRFPRPRPRISRSAPRLARRQPGKEKTKHRTVPFRVIEGRKNRDDEEPPRYH